MRTRRSERNYFISVIVFFAILTALFSLGVAFMLPETAPELEKELYGILCPAGTEVELQRNVFTLPGETRVTIEVFCIYENQEREQISSVLAFLVVGLAIPASLALVISLILAIPFALIGRSQPTSMIAPGQPIQWTSAISKTVQTPPVITYHGKQYNNINEMPPEARRAYEKAMAFLGQPIPEGNIDIAEDSQEVVNAVTSESNPTEKLKQLKEMLDAGLITQTEYNQKKAEILARL